MARIAVGGFHHETNVFAPLKAHLSAFKQRSDWPPLCVGENMLNEVKGINLGVTGAVEQLKKDGHEIIPLLWCSATPSAHVTKQAFEHIASMMINSLAQSAPVDGVLLDLHGAMVCEHISDGDGELIRRVRQHVGNDIPIAVCLDLHANISDQMFHQASVLEAYRTYPHVDMSDTGARAAGLLNILLNRSLSRFPAEVIKRPDFIIPPHWGCTLMEPARSIYRQVEVLDNETGSAMSLACGFPYSDVVEAGPAIVAYGFEAEAVSVAANTLLNEVLKYESAFNGYVYDADEAVLKALELALYADAPVILADTQDNPGGGGSGDTTGILQALVKHKVNNALVGVIIDSEFAKQAHTSGIGNTFEADLGEKSGFPERNPYHSTFKVLNLASAPFRATGPMMAGAKIDLGLTALVTVGGVKIVVGSKSMQTLDRSMFQHLGVELESVDIISLKSSVHFRNDFQAMAADILLVTSPGAVPADLSSLKFLNLRTDIRVG